MDVMIGSLVFVCLLMAGEARACARADRLWALVQPGPDRTGPPAREPGPRRVSGFAPSLVPRSIGIGLAAAAVGARLIGPPGAVACAALGAGLPLGLSRRKDARRAAALERQLAELVEGSATAVRSGLSVSQAIDHAGAELAEPMAGLLSGFAAEKRLGTPFDEALFRLGEAIGTDDARLFVVVVRLHARSGGNLAPALDEVAGALRHRIAVRRELRALSAQGRISGVILGSLPIAFFLVIGTTSHQELAPVYRSAAGMVMVGVGLVLDGVAFLWIRRLLRVRV